MKNQEKTKILEIISNFLKEMKYPEGGLNSRVSSALEAIKSGKEGLNSNIEIQKISSKDVSINSEDFIDKKTQLEYEKNLSKKTKIICVEFPNYLIGGYTVYIDIEKDKVLAIHHLAEG